LAENKKITELTEAIGVSSSSILLYVVDSTDGTPTGKKITGVNLGSAISGSAGVVGVLNDLTDVSVSSPNNNEVLTWNTSSGSWVALAPSSGSLSTLDSLTDVSASSPNNSDVLTWNSTSGSWVASAPIPLYLLDVLPTSPHSKDDEFSGSSLDAKWTNPITSTRTNTLSISSGLLTFEPSETGIASTGVRGAWGIRQDAPTGSFSISARIYLPRPANGNNDDARCGVFVANTSGSKAHVCGFQTSNNVPNDALGASYSEVSDWGAYDGWVVNGGAVVGPYIGMWYKITWDSSTSTIYFYSCFDGMEWGQFTSRGSQSQPDRIGVCGYSNSSSYYADRRIMVSWFRVTEP